MALSLQQLLALKQQMEQKNAKLVPDIRFNRTISRGVAPGAYGYASGGEVPCYADGTTDGPLNAENDPWSEKRYFKPKIEAKKAAEHPGEGEMENSAVSPEDAAEAAEAETAANPPSVDPETQKIYDEGKNYADGGDVSDDDADIPASSADAEEPLSTSIGEQLASKDPDALKEILENARQNASEAPYAAKEAEKEALAQQYKQIFGKQAAQDIVDQASVPGKTAAESAEVLSKALPEEIAATGGSEAAAGSLSKLLGPLGALTGLYGGSTAGPEQDELPNKPSSRSALVPYDKNAPIQSTQPPQDKLAELLASIPSSNSAVAPTIAAAKQKLTSAKSPQDVSDSTPTTAAAPAGTTDAVQVLLDKLGLGSAAQDKLAALQAAQKQNNANLIIEHGGDTISAAMARGRGGNAPVNEAYYQQAMANNALPIQQEMQRRSAVSQALDSGMKLSDLQDKTQADDPTSLPSQTARNLLASSFPSIANQPGFKNMSYSTLRQMSPMIDNIMTNETRNAMMKMRSDALAGAQQSRTDQKQESNFNQLTQLLEAQRSTNPAVGQAEKDLYSAKKAQTIGSMVGGGDLNNLNPQAVRLLTSEVAKIAQGGVPEKEELRSLTPDTLRGKLAGVWQQLSNDPTPANAGAFLKQYQDYAQGVAKDAQNVITDHYKRVIGTRMNSLTPEQKGYLQEYYLNRFGDANSSAKSNATGDFTPDVMNYAKAHNLTNEQALTIRNQRMGAQ